VHALHMVPIYNFVACGLSSLNFTISVLSSSVSHVTISASMSWYYADCD